jgi:hypothetical protein
MMKWVDRGLSVLLILGGVGHTFGVLDFYKDPHTLFWSLTASELIFLLAAINLLRSWQPSDRALAVITAAASLSYFGFTLRFGQIIGNLFDFRVILFGALTLGLTVFSLRDAFQRPRQM